MAFRVGDEEIPVTPEQLKKMREEMTQDWIPRNKTHGKSQTRLYRIYHLMKSRCNNPKDTSYAKYGARGITCNWDSFEDFARDMEQEYSLHVAQHGEQNTTIDRVDPDKDYNRENCRWATYKVQNNHKRLHKDAFWVKIGETTKILADWVKGTGLDYGTVYGRIVRLGWEPERALKTPVGNNGRNK